MAFKNGEHVTDQIVNEKISSIPAFADMSSSDYIL